MKIYAVFGYGYVLKEFMFIDLSLYDVTLNCLPCDWQYKRSHADHFRRGFLS